MEKMLYKIKPKLEKLLRASAKKPKYIDNFYEELCKTKLYIMQEGKIPKNKNNELKAGTNLELSHIDFQGEPHIPFFSSLEHLQSIIDKEVNYLCFNPIEFFEIVQDYNLIINPGSDFSKQFKSKEIKLIINKFKYSDVSKITQYISKETNGLEVETINNEIIKIIKENQKFK